MNINNFAICTGRLTADPVFFTHRDGSRTCRFTVAASNAFKSSDGSRGSQFIPLEAFVPADTKGSVYDLLKKGMLVSVEYDVRNNNYVDKKTGEQKFEITLFCDIVRIQESKAATEARMSAGEGETED